MKTTLSIFFFFFLKRKNRRFIVVDLGQRKGECKIKPNRRGNSINISLDSPWLASSLSGRKNYNFPSFLRLESFNLSMFIDRRRA